MSLIISHYNNNSFLDSKMIDVLAIIYSVFLKYYYRVKESVI